MRKNSFEENIISSEVPLIENINKTLTPSKNLNDKSHKFSKSLLPLQKPSFTLGTEDNIDSILLKEMGFPAKLINKVNLFLKPNSLEEAIQFMTKEKDKYQHTFFQSTGKKENVCFICGLGEEFHMDFGRKSLKDIVLRKRQSVTKRNKVEGENVLEISEKSKIEEEEQIINNFTCLICEDTFSKQKYPQFICGHKFCDDCLYEYIKEKINNAQVSMISCPSCTIELTQEDIEIIIKDDIKLKQKYGKFLIKNDIINDPNKKSCPVVNCDSYGEKIDDNKYIKCQNGHQFCFQCLKEWHENKKCEDEIEKDFLQWKKGKTVKKCPKCGFYTEKNKGCNHMICPECKFQWCWLCRGTYYEGHFEKGSGCAGLQFMDNELYQNCCCIWFYKFAVFTGFLLLYWFFSIIYLSFLIIWSLIEGLDSRLDDEGCFRYWCCYFYLWLIYASFAIAYIVIYYFLYFGVTTISIIPIIVYHPLLAFIMEYFEEFGNQFQY